MVLSEALSYAHSLLPDADFGNNQVVKAAIAAWPWLSRIPERYTCDCAEVQLYCQTFASYVAHLFDVHVKTIGDWTFSDLISYVESVEP